jgi:hypothetical protein
MHSHVLFTFFLYFLSFNSHFGTLLNMPEPSTFCLGRTDDTNHDILMLGRSIFVHILHLEIFRR